MSDTPTHDHHDDDGDDDEERLSIDFGYADLSYVRDKERELRDRLPAASSQVNYPIDWPQVKKGALEKAGHECQHCGASLSERPLVVQYYYPLNVGAERYTNILVWCAVCAGSGIVDPEQTVVLGNYSGTKQDVYEQTQEMNRSKPIYQALVEQRFDADQQFKIVGDGIDESDVSFDSSASSTGGSSTSSASSSSTGSAGGSSTSSSPTSQTSGSTHDTADTTSNTASESSSSPTSTSSQSTSQHDRQATTEATGSPATVSKIRSGVTRTLHTIRTELTALLETDWTGLQLFGYYLLWGSATGIARFVVPTALTVGTIVTLAGALTDTITPVVGGLGLLLVASGLLLRHYINQISLQDLSQSELRRRVIEDE